ncbi:hypothetical protein HETIRDRAFT_247227, partial [Heterobasidion irregulare TC 32-1]
VDDLAIFASLRRHLEKIKEGLKQIFEMTDLGPIHWLLGIEIKRDRQARTLSLSQAAYIDVIIARFNLDEANPLTTPLDPSFILNSTQSPSTPRQYEEM